MRGSRPAVIAAVLVLPYVPFLLGRVPGESFVDATLLGLAALVAPGAAGMLAGRGLGSARRAMHGLAGAALANVGAAVALVAIDVDPTPRAFATALALIVAAAAGVGSARGGRLPDLRGHRAAAAVAVVAFVVAAVAGTVIVPPLEDQDTEVQGTAYGLAHDLEPLCLTNRSTLYFFAHPLLLHALNASTLTLGGDLETVRPPYDAADSARQHVRTKGGRLTRAGAAFRGETHHPDRSRTWRTDVYEAFLQNPALTGTRAPNFVLAAVVAVLLFAGARRFGASAGDAALLTATYITLPEIVVRSGYGGYYALTAVTFLAVARLGAAESGGGRSGYLAGVLAVLANQKALIPAAAVGLVHLTRSVLSRAPRAVVSAVPLLLGMLLGGTAFWAYGLIVAPEEFVIDHLMDHGFRRFSGGEVSARDGAPVYAGRVGIWLEFARNFGWVWCATIGVGVVGAVRSLLGDPGNAARRRELGVLLAWVIVGAILFTATDWRQTKHLSLLVPAMVLLLAPLLAESGRARWTVRAALIFSIAWNGMWIARIATDFSRLVVTPVW